MMFSKVIVYITFPRRPSVFSQILNCVQFKRILNGYKMHEMFSDMPFMYGIVAVVVGAGVSFVSVIIYSRSVSVSWDDVFVVVVLSKDTVKVFILVG